MEYTLTAPKGKGLRDSLVAKAVIKAETEWEQELLAKAIVWISKQRQKAKIVAATPEPRP